MPITIYQYEEVMSSLDIIKIHEQFIFDVFTKFRGSGNKEVDEEIINILKKSMEIYLAMKDIKERTEELKDTLGWIE